MKKYVTNIIDNWIINLVKQYYGLVFPWEVGQELDSLYKRTDLELSELSENTRYFLTEFKNTENEQKI